MKRGFTVVELMGVVIAIMVAVATMANFAVKNTETTGAYMASNTIRTQLTPKGEIVHLADGWSSQLASILETSGASGVVLQLEKGNKVVVIPGVQYPPSWNVNKSWGVASQGNMLIKIVPTTQLQGVVQPLGVSGLCPRLDSSGTRIIFTQPGGAIRTISLPK